MHPTDLAKMYKGKSLGIEHYAQKTAAYGAAKDCSDKDFGPPKKKGAWDELPLTGVPEGNESPHRGEHPLSKG